MKALVIEHERATPGGLVNRWLDEQGAAIDVFEIDADERRLDPRDYDLIFSLGSEFSAHDDSLPWLHRESDLIRDAVRAEVPFVGICFGGQLLARVLGGDVSRAKQSEIGWLPINTRDPEVVAPGPWFQWHFDTFRPPPQADLVADSPVGPQAFLIGRSIGVQFHPEVTPEIMDEWVRVYRHELDAECVDAQALLEETERRAESSRETSWKFLNGILERTMHRAGSADRRGG